MEYKQRKYISLPEQEDFNQIQFDLNQMEMSQSTLRESSEYEQMHFEVNSIYEEVNQQVYPGYQGNEQQYAPKVQECNELQEAQAIVAQSQQAEINQQQYEQMQQMYQHVYQQSYQDGYYQGYNECYGQVYQQAYNQAYREALKQVQPIIGIQQSLEHTLAHANGKLSAAEDFDFGGAIQNGFEGATEPILSKVDIAVDQMESMFDQVNTMVGNLDTRLELLAQGAEQVAKQEVPDYVPAQQVSDSNTTEPLALGEEKKHSLEMENDGAEGEEAIKAKRRLKDIAIQEYKNDVALYVGKSGKNYIRKFSIMNETKQFLNWNFAAFLFGPVWYAYRKMPLIALALSLTTVVVLSGGNGLFPAVALMVLTGALSDKIYKAHVDRLLDARFLKDEKEQLNHMKLRGGVSIIYAMTLIVLMIGVGVYTVEVLVYKSDFARGIYENLLNLYSQYR